MVASIASLAIQTGVTALALYIASRIVATGTFTQALTLSFGSALIRLGLEYFLGLSGLLFDVVTMIGLILVGYRVEFGQALIIWIIWGVFTTLLFFLLPIFAFPTPSLGI